MTKHDRQDVPAPRRLLGIWAHPDDEAYLSAGLMAKTVAAGGRVTLVTLTNGEMGFPDDDVRSKRARAQHRQTELRSAMGMIGIDDIRYLDIADGEVAKTPETPVIAALAQIIDETLPDMIVTFGPDGITGHEDHIANSHLATCAWRIAGVGELLYAAKTPAWLDEWSDIHAELGVLMTDESTIGGSDHIEYTLELAGADLALKRKVLAAHSSQTEMLSQFFGEPDYLRWISQESFRKPTQAELQPSLPYKRSTCRGERQTAHLLPRCPAGLAPTPQPTPDEIADWCHQRRNGHPARSIEQDLGVRYVNA